MARNKFEAGTAIKITSTIKDTDNDLLDPTSVLITLWSGSTAAVVTDSVMTKQSTGVYFYIWQTTAATPTGIYSVKTTATYAGYTSVKTVDDLLYIG